MQTRDVIVIGGSAGALPALQIIIRGLPPNLPAAVFVVIHTAPTSEGYLPSILSKAGLLPADHASDGAIIQTGHIYVAPPDHHLIVRRGYMRITRGPRENRFRPAIDPLFRTASFSYGPRVVGVILSGGQDDGVLGLSLIKKAGGIALVQDPKQAESPSMPAAAIRNVAVDHILPAEDLVSIIAGLVRTVVEEDIVASNEEPRPDISEEGEDALHTGSLPGPPTPFTCPDCGGSLWELREGTILRYQCHVGHGYNSESLVSAQTDELEKALWTALRALEENSALRRRMANHALDHGMQEIADRYEEQARESEDRARVVRHILVTDSTADTAEPVPNT